MRTCVLSCLLVFMLQSANAANIFIVPSYHAEYLWDAEYIETLTSILGPDHTYTIRRLDSKRLPESEWSVIAKDVVAEILRSNPDLVITGDDNAMRTVAVPLNGSGIPVVFLGVNGTLTQYGVQGSNNITGVLERPFFERSVRHVRKVAPGRDRFLILMDNSVTMQNAVGEKFGSIRNTNIQGTEIDIVMTNSAEEWLNAVQTAQGTYDAIITGTYHTLRNVDGDYVPADEAMREAVATTQVPIFSFWNIFIGSEKAVGGYAITAYEEGKAAARMAQLILRGVSVASIPVSVSLSGQFVYNKEGMERWGLKLSALTKSQTFFVD